MARTSVVFVVSAPTTMYRVNVCLVVAEERRPTYLPRQQAGFFLLEAHDREVFPCLPPLA